MAGEDEDGSLVVDAISERGEELDLEKGLGDAECSDKVGDGCG